MIGCWAVLLDCGRLKKGCSPNNRGVGAGHHVAYRRGYPTRSWELAQAVCLCSSQISILDIRCGMDINRLASFVRDKKRTRHDRSSASSELDEDKQTDI